MAARTEVDWSSKPYAEWLEQVVRELASVNPCAIALEMIDEAGAVSTCYYNVSQNDRACMIGAMVDDDRMAWATENADILREIIMGEDEESDGEEAGTD